MTRLRLMAYAVFLMIVVVMIALLVGACSPGRGVYAFTVDPLTTRDVYVMDLDRDLYYALQVYGHEDQSPTWSREHRWFIFSGR